MPAKAEKRHVHKVKLSDYKAKKELEDSIEIELGDGAVIRCPPPELWSDEVMALAQDGDNLAASQELLGDQYDVFSAGGGSAAMLMGIVSDIHGVKPGE